MPLEEIQGLFLKRHTSMVIALPPDVFPHLIYIREAHRKRTVPVLPTEIRPANRVVHPFG
jgi:hypothetical protein